MASIITAEPAALSVAPVAACHESKCAPSITTSAALSVPGISAITLNDCAVSSWNVFHTLSSGHLTLQKLKADSPKLKQGSASLLLRERTEKRLELTITIDGADGKRVLDNKQSANIGEWLLFGQNVGDNGHIVALTCK